MLHLTTTGHEPDATVDASGARFAPIVDVTHDDDDTKSHMSDILLQLPASVKYPLNNSVLATLSPAGGDPVRNAHSLQPKPNQTGGAVLAPQEAVQLVTQQAREALHDQRETARLAPLH